MQELNDVYYEPLAEVLPSVEAILQGPPVMKLLFMTDPRIVDSKLKPDWQVMQQWDCQTNTCPPPAPWGSCIPPHGVPTCAACQR